MPSLADFDSVGVIESMYDRFATEVVKDIARRLIKMGNVTATAAWQMNRLIQAGGVYEDVLQRVAGLTGMTTKELAAGFKAYGFKVIKYDNALLQAAGLLPANFNISPAMMRVLVEGLRKTAGTLRNMVETIAGTSQVAFLDAADMAYMEVVHGAMPYNQAIKAAIKKMAADGVKVVEYPSGRKDQADVAMRRAVLTGVAQTANQLTWQYIVENDIDLIEVSAHIGARDKGSGPENHEMWQGRVYSRKGNPFYPDFLTTTGYGTITGLSGVNCRHSFDPFFEGMSERNYTDKELDEYANKTVTYNGQQISFYQGTQKQRAMERQIRAKKREAEALAAANLDNQAELAEVRAMQKKMRDFIDETKLQRQYIREGGKVPSVKVPKPKPAPAPVPPKPKPVPKVVSPPKTPAPSASTSWENGLKVPGGMEKAVKAGFVRAEDPTRRTGAFESHRVALSNGQFAIQKPQAPNSSYHYSDKEALAYDLDQLLGLNIIPETYFDQPTSASYQLFMKNTFIGRKAQLGDLYFPEEVGAMSLFDFITSNFDRHGGNWLFSQDGHLVAIDHGLAFVDNINEPSYYHLFARDALNSLDPAVWMSRNKYPINPGRLELLKELMYTTKALPNFIEDAWNRGIVGTSEKEAFLIRVEYIINNWYKYFEDYNG